MKSSENKNRVALILIAVAVLVTLSGVSVLRLNDTTGARAQSFPTATFPSTPTSGGPTANYTALAPEKATWPSGFWDSTSTPYDWGPAASPTVPPSPTSD